LRFKGKNDHQITSCDIFTIEKLIGKETIIGVVTNLPY
jgi:hypothetical protein